MSHTGTHADRLLGLPHRNPFLFVSELIELDPNMKGKGLWRVTGVEGFFRGHFPDNPVVPGVLLGESLAQLSGLVAFGDGEHATGESGVRLARIDLKFPLAAVPPADIFLEATLTRRLDAMVMFDVIATVSTEIVAIGSLVLASAHGASAMSDSRGSVS